MKYYKYPVKIGFKDGSGAEDFYIADANDESLVHGQGDCCKLGGIRNKAFAEIIVKMLNKERPKIRIEYL